MNTTKRVTLVSALSILVTLANAAPTSPTNPPDISGTYTCKYHDPSSTPPDGTETIVFTKNGNAYSVKMIASGDTFPYNYGTAVFNKNVNDAFAFITWKIKDITSFSSDTVNIKPDGTLDLIFVTTGYRMGTETCTKSAS